MKSKEERTNNLENILSGTVSGSQSRKDSINYDLICPVGGGASIEGEIGNKVLKRIKTGVQKYKADIINSNSYIGANYYSNSKSDSDNANDNHTITGDGNDNGTPRRRSRILCMIYTVNLPNDNHTNLRSIAQTWGRQCDGFFVASNSTDHSLGAIDLVHLGQESYSNMWQKIRTIFAYAYDHFRDDYDFFHIAGDDTYVAVDNLRAYLDGPDVKRLEEGYVDKIISKHSEYSSVSRKRVDVHPRPLYFGSPVIKKDVVFPGGGSGYTLNRAALEVFSTKGMAEFLPNSIDSREDIFIGSFFSSDGIILSNTVDDHGGRRYLVMDADVAGTYFEGQVGPDNPKALQQIYNITLATGLNSVSEQGIAIHLKSTDRNVKRDFRSSDLIRRYHAIINDLCD